MADERVEIEIVLDDGSIQKGFVKMEQQAKKSGRKAGRALQDGIQKRAVSGLKQIGGQIALLGTAFVTAFGGRAAIQAAAAQEDAVSRLNASLRNSGDFTRAASQDIQDYAASLQQTTVFGDEVILNQIALAKAYGATNEQAKNLVAASTELAAAQGTDLESATRQIAKTFGGLAGELGETIPAIKSLTQEQLRAGAAIQLIRGQFAGFAAAEAQTFSGALTQVQNAFGDLLEEIGFLITKSPVVVAAFNFVKEAIVGASGELKGFREGNDIIGDTILLAADLVVALDPIVRWFEFASDNAMIFFQGLKVGIQTVIFGIAELVNTFVGLFDVFAKIPGVGDKFKAVQAETQLFRDSTKETLDQFSEDARETFEKAYGFEASDKIKQFAVDFKNKVNEVANTQRQLKDQAAESTEAITEDLTLFGGLITDTVVFKTKEGLEAAKKSLQDFEKASKKAFLDGFGRAVGGGFAAFGKALATGEDAIGAFAKAFLASIAQMAIQQGTQFILQGIGYQFVPGLQGTGSALIAAGAGLATFGGALSAIAGGGGGGGAGGGGGSGGGGGGGVGAGVDLADSGIVEAAEVEPAEDTANVTVNVEGSVFADEGVGDRLADLVSDSFDQRGVRVFQG